MTFSQLNPQQIQAVEHIDGPLLVLAGAGSGKTRVVTSRIAYLIEKGVPPEQILAVTFTNKAAQEMLTRVQKLVAQNVKICTFHSLGVSLLKEAIHLLDGYSSSFSIYDEEDSLKLIRDCLKDLDIPEQKLKVKSAKAIISKIKNQLIPLEEIEDENFTNAIPPAKIRQFFTLYQDRLRDYQALDFDDLLYLSARLLKRSSEALQYFQNKWKYLLIDEYQDTNQAQYYIANKLVEKSHNVFVVGDPDQSIYSWRGANIENILRFQKDYPGAKLIKLEQNYRSTESILEAANALITHNSQRLEKNLYSQKGKGEPISLFVAHDDRHEARYIAKQILGLVRKQQVSLNDVVIFYRTNFQSRSIEDQLLNDDIPYQIIGGISFYQRKEVKDILAFLKLLLTQNDLIAFKRTINLPKRGIGEATINKIVDYAQQCNLKLLDALREILNSPGPQTIKLNKSQQESLKDYINLFGRLHSAYQQHQSLQKLIEECIDFSHYLTYLKVDPDTFEDRKQNIEELIAKGAEKDFCDTPITLAEFLEEISLKNSADDSEEETEKVSLMTLHNGKGLEFDFTFLSGLEEELFPHINSYGSEMAIEEERRLCYVGITRARKKLFISLAQSRFLWGQQKTMRPSRFLKELPKELIKKETFFSSPSTLSSQTTSSKPLRQTGLSELGLKENTRVYHKEFGAGIIVKVSENNMGLVYRVRFFGDNSEKNLLADYAPLKAM